MIRALMAGLGLLGGAAAAEGCRLALMLALDVSISVDPTEERLQREGLARALVAPPVVEAFLSGDPVAVHAFEWSGAASQAELWPGWVLVETDADLHGLAGAVRGALRGAGPDDFTAVGAALLHAADGFGTAPDCRARTLDVSGDGWSNDGPSPAEAYADPRFDRITVNGLLIGGGWDEAQVADWYRAEVLHGPGTFLVVARDYGDLARAMTAKLVRELDTRVVGKGAR